MKRILLDESLPRPVRQVLADLDIFTVQEMGWAGLQNGDLLSSAQESFDVLLTGDKNIRFQQNLGKLMIGVVIAAGKSTKLEDLLPLIPGIRKAIEAVLPGRYIEVEPE